MASETKQKTELAVEPHNPSNIENGETFTLSKGEAAIAEDTVAATSEYTAEQYRKLLWKIDLWLLPVMWVGFWAGEKSGFSNQNDMLMLRF